MIACRASRGHAPCPRSPLCNADTAPVCTDTRPGDMIVIDVQRKIKRKERGERDNERQREKRQAGRQTHRQTHRQTQTETDTKRHRQRQTQRQATANPHSNSLTASTHFTHSYTLA